LVFTFSSGSTASTHLSVVRGFAIEDLFPQTARIEGFHLN